MNSRRHSVTQRVLQRSLGPTLARRIGGARGREARRGALEGLDAAEVEARSYRNERVAHQVSQVQEASTIGLHAKERDLTVGRVLKGLRPAHDRVDVGRPASRRGQRRARAVQVVVHRGQAELMQQRLKKGGAATPHCRDQQRDRGGVVQALAVAVSPHCTGVLCDLAR